MKALEVTNNALVALKEYGIGILTSENNVAEVGQKVEIHGYTTAGTALKLKEVHILSKQKSTDGINCLYTVVATKYESDD